jgi:hypothetical protein
MIVQQECGETENLWNIHASFFLTMEITLVFQNSNVLKQQHYMFFCKKKELFIDKKYMSWDIFMPAMKSYKESILDLLIHKALAIILVESMSGFCPSQNIKERWTSAHKS